MAEREGLLGAARLVPSLRFGTAVARAPASPSQPTCLYRDSTSDLIFQRFQADWRRGRDSNPRRAFDPYALSRGAPSTTRPPLPSGKAHLEARDDTRPEQSR